MGDFNTEAFTLLGVAIVIIALRITARWIMVGPKSFKADDYLMLLACVSSSSMLPIVLILLTDHDECRLSMVWKPAPLTWLADGSWALPITP